MNESLTCSVCRQTWVRERKPGRKPVSCPGCRESPVKNNDTTKGKDTTPQGKVFSGGNAEPSERDLSVLPFTQRTSGWCTDYKYGPVAAHEKCDGDLGKYRCPCHCHGWSDAA